MKFKITYLIKDEKKLFNKIIECESVNEVDEWIKENLDEEVEIISKHKVIENMKNFDFEKILEKKKCKKEKEDKDNDIDLDNDGDVHKENENVSEEDEILEKTITITEDSLELLDEILENEQISEKMKEKITSLFETVVEFLGEDENGELNEFRKVVFRNGKKQILNKKRLKGAEKIKRKMAAKKAARKRKGKKRKATSILKMKKSLKMRHRMGM